MLLDPGKALVRALNIPEKSIFSYTLQVAVAFFLSGALHALTLPRGSRGASPLRYGGFFWIQCACVVIEAIVEHMVGNMERFKPSWIRRCVGLVRIAWVLGVMYNTVPVIFGELVKVAMSVPVFFFPEPKS